MSRPDFVVAQNRGQAPLTQSGEASVDLLFLEEVETFAYTTPPLFKYPAVASRLNVKKFKAAKKGPLGPLTGLIRQGVGFMRSCRGVKVTQNRINWVDELLTYSEEPLKFPLLKTKNKKDVKFLSNVFYQIKAWETALLTGDNREAVYLNEILDLGQSHYEFRDEIFLFVFKQIRNNPNPNAMWRLLHILSSNLHCSQEIERFLKASLMQFGLFGEAENDLRSVALKIFDQLNEPPDSTNPTPDFLRAKTELRECIFPLEDKIVVEMLSLDIQASYGHEILVERELLEVIIQELLEQTVLDSRTVSFWADAVISFIKSDGLGSRQKARQRFIDCFRGLEYHNALCALAVPEVDLPKRIKKGKEVVLSIIDAELRIALKKKRQHADTIPLSAIQDCACTGQKNMLCFTIERDGQRLIYALKTEQAKSFANEIAGAQSLDVSQLIGRGEPSNTNIIEQSEGEAVQTNFGESGYDPSIPSPGPSTISAPSTGRRLQSMFRFTQKMFSEDEQDERELERTRILLALSTLKQGTSFAGKYTIQQGEIREKPQIVYARNEFLKKEAVLKFYFRPEYKENSLKYYVELDSLHICKIFDEFGPRDGLPPCLALEKGQQTLYEWMKEHHHYRHDRLAVLNQILKALEYLHGLEIVHGDLKPQNIMKYQPGDVWKLIDFDTASHVSEKRPFDYTVAYAAPEVVKYRRGAGDVAVDCSADMWSFGIIAYEVLSGGKRFYGAYATSDLIERRLQTEISFCPEIDLEDEEERKFVEQLIVFNPADRLKAKKALTRTIFCAATETVSERERRQQEEAARYMEGVNVH